MKKQNLGKLMNIKKVWACLDCIPRMPLQIIHSIINRKWFVHGVCLYCGQTYHITKHGISKRRIKNGDV